MHSAYRQQGFPLSNEADIVLTAKSAMTSFVDSHWLTPFSLANALIVAIGIKKKDEIAGSFGNWKQFGTRITSMRAANDV